MLFESPKPRTTMNKYGTPWTLRKTPQNYAVDWEHGSQLVLIHDSLPDIAELICAAPRMLEALKIAKAEFEARDGAGTCPVEIEELLEELSQHNATRKP